MKNSELLGRLLVTLLAGMVSYELGLTIGVFPAVGVLLLGCLIGFVIYANIINIRGGSHE